MPSTAFNKSPIPTIQESELKALPPWAREEYRNSQNVLAQLLQNIVKLESNVADLEMMLEKDEYPRSICIKVTVNVNEAQQSDMDTALNNAKKQFEKSVLQALINARKAELASKKNEADRKAIEFQDFMVNRFAALERNNIPLPPEDADPQITIQVAANEFQKRAETVNQQLRTYHFFSRQQALDKKHAREAAAQERRLNQELQDSNLNQLIRRMEKIEKKLETQKLNRTGLKPRSRSQFRQAGKTRKTQLIRTKRNTRQQPKDHPGRNQPAQDFRARGGQVKRTRQPPRLRSSSNPIRSRKKSKKFQGLDQENQPRRFRSTSTMNRSASLPPNYRKRQN